MKEHVYKLPKIVGDINPPYDEWVFEDFINSDNVDVICSRWKLTSKQVEEILRKKIKEKIQELQKENQSLHDRLSGLDIESFSE